jgi:hypothetical protein
MIVLEPPNTLPEIGEIYAFLSMDAAGNEGLCAYQARSDLWLPMVFADKKKIEILSPMAQEIANNSKHDVVLVKFNNREELKRFTKGKSDGT